MQFCHKGLRCAIDDVGDTAGAAGSRHQLYLQAALSSRQEHLRRQRLWSGGDARGSQHPGQRSGATLIFQLRIKGNSGKGRGISCRDLRQIQRRIDRAAGQQEKPEGQPPVARMGRSLEQGQRAQR